MKRALEPLIVRPRMQPATPFFPAPAPNPSVTVPPTNRPVLNPFSVAAKGEELLRRELGALRGWHLRNIVRAYGLADEATDLGLITEAELIAALPEAARSRGCSLGDLAQNREAVDSDL